MTNNKKKNKNIGKGINGDSPSGPDHLNAEVLESLIGLADTLAYLDKAHNHHDAKFLVNTTDGSSADVADKLVEKTTTMALADDATAKEVATLEGSKVDTTISSAPPPTTKLTLVPPALTISHWRTPSLGQIGL